MCLWNTFGQRNDGRDRFPGWKTFLALPGSLNPKMIEISALMKSEKKSEKVEKELKDWKMRHDVVLADYKAVAEDKKQLLSELSQTKDRLSKTETHAAR